MALLLTICFTNFYLTRSLFRHISEPLDELVAGVERIQRGDLDSPIAYAGSDEFKVACDAVDLMSAKLKAALEAEQRRTQSHKELIAGMSHDLKSPLTHPYGHTAKRYATVWRHLPRCASVISRQSAAESLR